MNKKAVNLFLDSATERHEIYMKKSRGEPRPWTADPVLHKYSFCNVFRQLDKTTVWIKEKVIDQHPSIEALWPAIIVYRYISSINIFRRLEGTLTGPELLNMDKVHLELCKIIESGQKFNGCFIRNPRIKGGWTKIHHVPFLLVREIEEDGQMLDILSKNSFFTLTKYLSRFSATSGFMGHQYSCDLEYTDHFYPTDKYSYATMGPGSRKGMNIVTGNHIRNRMSQMEWTEHAKVLRELMEARFKYIFNISNISMQEVQNWLCEFQKYVKFRHSEKTGQKYKVRLYKG